jgi:hypothetical protein
LYILEEARRPSGRAGADAGALTFVMDTSVADVMQRL